MLIYIEVDVDVQSPEGSSPIHTLPSLSGGKNEKGERGEGPSKRENSSIQGNHMEQAKPPGQWNLQQFPGVNILYILIQARGLSF